MGVLLQNDQPVGGISADVIETINFSDLTTTSKTLPGAINELAANPSTTESMSQAEYNALTEAEKMDGTARFVYDAISTDESELWTRVGRNTLHTDAQIISNAINEIKDTMGSGALTTTSPTIIGGINELNSNLNKYKWTEISDITLDSVVSGGSIRAFYNENELIIFISGLQISSSITSAYNLAYSATIAGFSSRLFNVWSPTLSDTNGSVSHLLNITNGNIQGWRTYPINTALFGTYIAIIR